MVKQATMGMRAQVITISNLEKGFLCIIFEVLECKL